MKNIGEKLRVIRKNKGLTGKQLELKSGITQMTISRIENNTHSPSIDTLEQLCEALEVSMNDLIDDNEKLPIDLINLINTAKKLTPEQRKKVNEMLETFLFKN